MNWAIVELLGMLLSLCGVSWCEYKRELYPPYLFVLNFHTGCDLLHLPFSVCRHRHCVIGSGRHSVRGTAAIGLSAEYGQHNHEVGVRFF
jgi:hypothetical protein